MATHNFKFNVDTSPMADKISEVSKKVNGTTGAVVAMKTAVLAAGDKGAEHVCKNVNKGFYSLMRSQISQKIAANKSRVEALLMELQQQQKRLLDIKSTMERDYFRIATRYQRIILSINKSLHQRVADLDKPVFDFCERDLLLGDNRKAALAGTAPIVQKETLTSSQHILMAAFKSDTLRAVDGMASLVRQIETGKRITKAISISEVTPKKATLYMPVTVCISIVDKEQSKSVDVATPDDSTTVFKQTVENTVKDTISNIKWARTEAVDERLKMEFQKLCETAGLPERERQIILRLFNENNFETVEGGKS